MKKQIPIRKNEYYEIEIHGMGNEGEGVGRIRNFTVFVPYALPGDRIKTKIIKVKSSYAYGKLIDIIKPSQHRVDPICSRFTKCGGCQIQHVDYREQLMVKKQKVIDALKRIGKLENITVHDVIGMDKPLHYRNKVQFPVGRDAKTGKIQVGFYAPKSHCIIEMDTCPIQHEANDAIVAVVKGWIDENKISVYDEKSGEGLIRHIYARVAFRTGEIMVVLVTNSNNLPHQEELVARLQAINSNIRSIIQNINTRKSNIILGEKNRVIWGKDGIIDSIGGIRFQISPLSFYQINPVQTEVLYQKALEYAGLTGNETVFDLYCGIGTISLFLAQRAKKVIGVEIVPEAVDDARRNAAINEIENVEFHTGAAEDVVPELISKGYNADVVVVDPPRKGCDEVLLDTIVQMNAQKMVYVSCNPSTLARDLRFLADRGYEVLEVQPVDMFPHTGHVETVVLMSKVEK